MNKYLLTLRIVTSSKKIYKPSSTSQKRHCLLMTKIQWLNSSGILSSPTSAHLLHTKARCTHKLPLRFKTSIMKPFHVIGTGCRLHNCLALYHYITHTGSDAAFSGDTCRTSFT